MIVFFAVASLGFATDVLTTRLGTLVLGFAAALSLSRAVREIVISPHFSALIFDVCLAIAGVCVVLRVGSSRRPAATVEG